MTMDRWFSERRLHVYRDNRDGSLHDLGHETPAGYLLNHTPRQRAEVRAAIEVGEAIEVFWDGNGTIFSPHNLAERGAVIR